jgi:hypothetical protein
MLDHRYNNNILFNNIHFPPAPFAGRSANPSYHVSDLRKQRQAAFNLVHTTVYDIFLFTANECVICTQLWGFTVLFRNLVCSDQSFELDEHPLTSTDEVGDRTVEAIQYGDKKAMQWEVSATEAEVSEEEAFQYITTVLIVRHDIPPTLPYPALWTQEPKSKSEKKKTKVGYPKLEGTRKHIYIVSVCFAF